MSFIDLNIPEVPEENLRDLLGALIEYLNLEVVAWHKHDKIQFYTVREKQK